MIDFNVAVAYQPSLQFQKREILWISTGNFFCFWNSLAADDPGKRFTGWSYRDTIKAFKTVLVKVAENCKWNSTLHAIGRNFCAYAEDQIFARFDIEVIKRKFWVKPYRFASGNLKSIKVVRECTIPEEINGTK